MMLQVGSSGGLLAYGLFALTRCLSHKCASSSVCDCAKHQVLWISQPYPGDFFSVIAVIGCRESRPCKMLRDPLLPFAIVI